MRSAGGCDLHTALTHSPGLHARARARSGRAISRGTADGVDAEKLMTLLLKTSQLEYIRQTTAREAPRRFRVGGYCVTSFACVAAT